MKRMQRAVLYARVSSDLQQKEGTIQSQVAELQRQIAAAGDTLVTEYIDDGYSGALLDRPAMNQLRDDLKVGTFDAIYFLAADRICREVTYQNIIIAEMPRYKKQIIINGQDYIHNPENKFTLTVLGAVAELERAKIIERTTRGKLHRLRQIVSHGHCIYGYEYVKKSPRSPAALVINPHEAAIVRSIFEQYASGSANLFQITRSLERAGVPTRRGKKLWRAPHVRKMLQNHTYTGIRYYNRLTVVKDAPFGTEGTKLVMRDRSEWIAVKVPAIVSHELFERVQERMRQGSQRYRQPTVVHLLSGLVECGECGCGFYRTAGSSPRSSSSESAASTTRPRTSVTERQRRRCTRRS
jgi:site-specific DNA recombinase